MQQIKLFVELESNADSLERKINEWLGKSGAKVVHIFGNIAPQTVASDSKGQGLTLQRFSSSDILIAIVYESA